MGGFFVVAGIFRAASAAPTGTAAVEHEGELVEMRLGDGVHYTGAGGERVARAVVRELRPGGST